MGNYSYRYNIWERDDRTGEWKNVKEFRQDELELKTLGHGFFAYPRRGRILKQNYPSTIETRAVAVGFAKEWFKSNGGDVKVTGKYVDACDDGNVESYSWLGEELIWMNGIWHEPGMIPSQVVYMDGTPDGLGGMG